MYISSGLPDDNFGGSNDNYIGMDASKKMNIGLCTDFPIIFPNNDLIISASLTLTCDVVSQHASGQTQFYTLLQLIANLTLLRCHME